MANALQFEAESVFIRYNDGKTIRLGHAKGSIDLDDQEFSLDHLSLITRQNDNASNNKPVNK